MDDTNPTLTPFSLSLSTDNGIFFYFLKIKDQPFPTEKVKTRGLPGLKYQADLVKILDTILTTRDNNED